MNDRRGEKERLIHFILYACVKYETYFQFDGIDTRDASHEMVRKYHRLREILEACRKEELSDEEVDRLYNSEVGDLYHDIKRREFVCKVSGVAYLGGTKMIAEFWGDYYTEIDFEEILKLPEVQEMHPELEKLRNPEVFNQVYPAEYHVFFGTRPERVDVSSDFIWHFGKRIRQLIHEEEYEWVKGF